MVLDQLYSRINVVRCKQSREVVYSVAVHYLLSMNVYRANKFRVKILVKWIFSTLNMSVRSEILLLLKCPDISEMLLLDNGTNNLSPQKYCLGCGNMRIYSKQFWSRSV